jgi:3-isopropylmalate/(R)-2-methylmalate dehydratase small subunit
MTGVSEVTGIAAPLLRDNVDTDAVIPSREMRSTGKSGFADGLFAGWRYTRRGGARPTPTSC